MARSLSAGLASLALACGSAEGPPAGGTSPDDALLWRLATGTRSGAPPAVGAGGLVFVGGAADSETRAPSLEAALRVPCLWAVSTSGAIVDSICGGVTDDWQATPPDIRVVVTEWGSAYGVDADGGLYARTVSGKRVKGSAGMRVQLNPVIGPDATVYVGFAEGVVGLAMESTTNPIRWEYANGSPAPWLAIAPDRTLYVGSTRGGRLYAFDGHGRQKWSVRGAAGALAADPEGGVFAADRKRLTAYNAGGVVLWTFEAPADLSGLTYDARGRRVYATSGAIVYAFDRRGQEAWTFEVERRVASPVVVGPGGRVFVVSARGRVHALSPEGSELFALQVSPGDRQGLAVSEGRLYVHSTDGHLYAFALEG